MLENIETLWELQQVDSESAALELKIQNIPKELQQSTDKIKAKEEEIKTTRNAEKEIANKRKTIETDIELSKDKIVKYKSQLLRIKTNKEYQALLHEINTEEIKITTYEEEEIRFITESDALKAKIEKMEKKLKEEKTNFIVKEKKLNAELTQLKQELALKEEQHNFLSKKLPTYTLSRYEQIKKGRQGIGVVAIYGYICKGCKTTLPPQFVVELKKRDKIITCEQCGRILIWKEEK